MEIINIHNIFEFNQQYKSRKFCYYETLFINDFYYTLRQRHEQLIKFSNPKNDEIILEKYFENKLINIINDAITQLLLEGKSYFIMLESQNNIINNKLVLYNLFANQIVKGIKNYIFNNGNSKTYKINNEHVIEIKLSEVGYKSKFFTNPINELDENYKLLMSDRFIYDGLNHKVFYSENDTKQVLITKDIYWDCGNYNNDRISIPYSYYRKEKFYNLRVKIFKYIIQKINKGISRLAKVDFDFINVSNKISEMDLYSQYIANKISLKQLQDGYFKSINI